MQPLETIALPGTVSSTLSVFELFLQSDTIVKLVMLMLVVASFWSWAVIFDKTLRLRRLKQAAESFEETFWSGGSLDDLYDRVGQRPVDPMSAVFAAAMREWRRSAAKGLLGTQVMRLSLQQRIASCAFCSSLYPPKSGGFGYRDVDFRLEYNIPAFGPR